MSDIFQEVDEIMKQERMEKFWKQNGTWIIAFIVLTIVGTAAISGYKYWNAGVQEKQTAILLGMFDEPDFPAGVIEQSQDLRPGLRGLALLGAANHQMEAGNKEKALEFYKNAAQDSALPDDFQGMAQIMTARMDDGLSADEKLAMLKEVFDNGDSPWRFHAQLEAALVEAHDNNDYAAARFHIERILRAEGAVSPSLLNRAKSLDHVYTLKQESAEDTPASGAEPQQDAQDEKES
jgi:hypothetical protein